LRLLFYYTLKGASTADSHHPTSNHNNQTLIKISSACKRKFAFNFHFYFRTHSKFWSTLSSTPDPEKIQPGLVVPVLFVVKLWMCLLSDVSTKPSGFCALVPVKLASETSNPSLNVLLMSSSTLPREVPTPTQSRRRTNLNVSPSLTDKMLNAFYCMNE